MVSNREILEFRNNERQVRLRSRLGGRAALKPIEQIYFEALDVAEENPARALGMLQSLVALYDPFDKVIDFTDAKSVTKQFDKHGDPRLLVVARQRIGQLNEQVRETATMQLPALRERLAQAAILRQANPAGALRIYQAIVRLYEDQEWAREAVDKAKFEIERMNYDSNSRTQ